MWLSSPNIQMQDIDYTATSSIALQSSPINQEFEITKGPESAGNRFSDSEIYFHSHIRAEDLPSNGSEVPEVTPGS